MTATRGDVTDEVAADLVGLDAPAPADPVDLDAPATAAPAHPAPGVARRAPRLRRLWFVPAAVAVLGAAALLPAVGGRGPGPGEARLDVNGTAVVTTADGARRTVRDGRTEVGPGDQVAVVDGTTRFEMADGVRLEGTGSADDRAGTTVVMAVAPRLVSGPLLAVAPRPLEVRAGDHLVSVDATGTTAGAARLERGVGLGVGAYAGAVAVESAGRTAPVAPLRRVEVAAAGALDDGPRPLRYAADDPWDRRYLGEALAIDAQLAALLASSTALTSGFLDPATLAAAVDLPPVTGLRGRLADLDDGGDALVLAAITAAGGAADAARAWDAALAFHREGAPWGLVALDRGARSERVLAAVRSALDTIDLTDLPATAGADAASDGDPTDGPAAADAAEAGAGADAAGAAPTVGTDAADGTDPADSGAGGGAGGEVEEPVGGGGGAPVPPGVPAGPSVPEVPPVSPPSVPSIPGVVGGAGGAVGGVVDGAAGGIDGIVPGAGGAVGGVVDGAGGAVGGLGGAVEGAGGAAGGAVGGVVGAAGGIIGGLGSGIAGGG